MQQGLTLPALANRLHAETKSKRDLIVNTGSTELVVVDNTVTLQHHDPDVSGADFGGQLNGVAHDQLATYLNIPTAYYRRMLQQTPALLVDNANTWLKKNEPENRMLRTLHGGGRAWLSDQYLRIENWDVLEVALQALHKKGVRDEQIISANVTDTHLYLEVVFPNLDHRVANSPRVDDVVRGGVVLRNSEVGHGHFDVSEFDYRLWCLNGAVHGSLFKRRHTGQKILDNEALWSVDTKKLMDKTVISQIGDMIGQAADADRFQKRMEKVDAMTGMLIKGDPAKAVKVMAKVLGPAVGLTESEESSILLSLVNQGDGASAFGLMQAMTAQANDNADYDRAIELQEAGGKLLSLNKGDWNRILEAA